jgi:protein TonB
MSGGRGPAREAARWLISGALVLGAHGGAAAVLVGWSEPMPAGAPSQVVMLDLGSVGAPPAPKTDSPPAPTDSDYSPSPDPVDKIEKEELKPPEKVVEPQPEPVPDPPKEVAERQPDPEPPPPEPPKMKPAEVVLPKPAPPRPQAKPVQKKQQMASLQSRRASQEEAAERPAAVSAGASGAARATYAQQLVAHLQRYKRYPEAARAARAHGITLVTFVLDRSGRLVSSRIARGSGYAELDRETMEVVRRAQPYPTPPAEVTGQLQYTAPLRYDLPN